MQVDIEVKIRFSVEVKDQADADTLYDPLTSALNDPKEAAYLLADMIDNGAEVEIEEISQVY